MKKDQATALKGTKEKLWFWYSMELSCSIHHHRMLQVLNVTWIQEEIRKACISKQQVQSHSMLCVPEAPDTHCQTLGEGTGDYAPRVRASTLPWSSLPSLLHTPAEKLPNLLVAFKNPGVEAWSLGTHIIVDKRAAKLERVQACCIL